MFRFRRNRRWTAEEDARLCELVKASARCGTGSRLAGDVLPSVARELGCSRSLWAVKGRLFALRDSGRLDA